GKVADRRRGLANVLPLVSDLLHALLGETVADELPPALESGTRDRAVSLDRRALIASTAGMRKWSSTSSIRQNPTRLPYSCQAQFGLSGIGAPPAGGVSTIRGIGWVESHSSILTMTQTASRAPSGSASLGRWLIAEKSIRSDGSMTPSLIT